MPCKIEEQQTEGNERGVGGEIILVQLPKEIERGDEKVLQHELCVFQFL